MGPPLSGATESVAVVLGSDGKLLVQRKGPGSNPFVRPSVVPKLRRRATAGPLTVLSTRLNYGYSCLAWTPRQPC